MRHLKLCFQCLLLVLIGSALVVLLKNVAVYEDMKFGLNTQTSMSWKRLMTRGNSSTVYDDTKQTNIATNMPFSGSTHAERPEDNLLIGPICDIPTPEYPGGSRSEVTNERLARAREMDKLLPLAYVITPTYARLTQEADLLRLCYTLMHVPRVHWILIEDSKNKTKLVTDLLKSCPGPTKTHLTALSEPGRHGTRGVNQRNAAISWLRRCFLPGNRTGGVYFADDDNTYNIRVFDSVRWTQLVSVWLVGIVGGAWYEGPVCSEGKVMAWQGSWYGNRKFPIDMAAYAVGLDFLLTNKQTYFLTNTTPGYLETNFLQSLNITLDKITPQPDANCSKILAWHTKTSNPTHFVRPKIHITIDKSAARNHRHRTF